MTDRARITITDVVYALFGLAALAGLYPAYAMVLDDTAPMLGQGPALLFGTLLPVALLVLLAVIYVDARSGGAR